MHPRAVELIERLDLRPHPEGGYYREVYRSASKVAPADDRGARASLTTIYFLLTDDAVSRWWSSPRRGSERVLGRESLGNGLLV